WRGTVRSGDARRGRAAALRRLSRRGDHSRDSCRAPGVGDVPLIALALDKALQPAERLVPLRRDRLQMPPRIREALLFKLPDALPSELLAAYEAGLLHHPQMLRDRLTRDRESFREPRDRHRAVVTEARDEAQPRLVTQRGEHRGGGDEVRGCSPR